MITNVKPCPGGWPNLVTKIKGNDKVTVTGSYYSGSGSPMSLISVQVFAKDTGKMIVGYSDEMSSRPNPSFHTETKIEEFLEKYNGCPETAGSCV